MSRAQTTDYLHTHKYHVVDLGGEARLGNIAAGFNTMIMPEYTVDVTEYKEGIWTYRRKYPGDVTVTDLTMTRGVSKTDTSFFAWVKDAIEGNEYRTDLEIRHFHRDDVSGLLDYTQTAAQRVIKCLEVTPMRVKLGTDLDALSAEVSIKELDVSLERLQVSTDGGSTLI